MEAIKFERPFHSHLSFNVMCRFLGDYSLGRDVPCSSGPEKHLCLFVWHLPWWVIYLLLLHQGGELTALVGDGEEGTQLAALLTTCESLLVAPTVFLGLEVSRNPPQGSRRLVAKLSTSVDQLGCGCAQATPSWRGMTVTVQGSPSPRGMRWWGCVLGAPLPQLCNGTEVLAERSSHYRNRHPVEAVCGS